MGLRALRRKVARARGVPVSRAERRRAEHGKALRAAAARRAAAAVMEAPKAPKASEALGVAVMRDLAAKATADV